MATRAQVERLRQRIEKLKPSAMVWPGKVVSILHDPKVDQAEEAARERHFAKRPQDRDANTFIIIRIVDPLALN